MKKRDKIIILSVVLIALLSFVGYRISEKQISQENYVVISVNGEIYKTVSLSDPQIVVIENNGHHNEIEITEEGVRMLASNCDNQVCVMQGEATLENIDNRLMGGWIVCLPHQISIELVKGDSNEN
ncbi:MAG: NusG domain II-containing protein [Sedimentibacter sp.]